MRALLLILIASSALGQGRFDRFNQRTDQGRSTRGFEQSRYAFFEFAPASGAGMGAACACTPITGAKGEAMTFTRTGAATCSKQGLATTGIANGDLVVCANNNEPRVEPSGGVLGLRVESARTNEALRAEQWNNAAWLSANSGVAAVTVTADQAIAPDGTTTAERIQVPATTSGQYSYVYQGGFSSVQRVSSFYVKGNGGSGSINLLNGSTPNACVRCNYVATSWTRCELASIGAASTFFFVGNDSSSAVCGTSDKTAVDAFVWGMQHEAGAYAISYIPTVAAAATRNVESPAFALSPTVGPSACVAASVQWPSTAVGAVNFMAIETGANSLTLYRTSDTAAGYLIRSATTAPVVSSMSTTVHRALLRDASGTRAAFWDGASVSAPTDSMLAAVDTAWIGRNTAGIPADGIVTRVQVDPSPSRCTP